MKETYDRLVINPNFQIPAGWEIVPVGSIMRASYKYSAWGGSDIKIGWYNNSCIRRKIRKDWCVVIREIKAKNVGPAIPDGYRIIKPGEVIPSEYWCINGKNTTKDISKWTYGNNDYCSGMIRANDSNYFITKIIPPAPKTYNIELTAEQINIIYSVFKPKAGACSIYEKVSEIKRKNNI